MRFKVKKADKEQQIVWGEVYIPNRIDTHGHMMLPSDVRKLAYSFMRKNLEKSIDTQHDNWSNGSYPIESFIARKGDADYEEGAWVLGVKVTDKRLWKQVKSGELAGYSFEGTAIEQEAVVEATVLRQQLAWTLPAPDGHRHFYVVSLDEDGKVLKGATNTVNGHRHLISKGTATDETKDHKHRFTLQ